MISTICMPKSFGPALFVREIGADEFLDFCKKCVIPSFLMPKTTISRALAFAKGAKTEPAIDFDSPKIFGQNAEKK